jgi:hypothetical protein
MASMATPIRADYGRVGQRSRVKASRAPQLLVPVASSPHALASVGTVPAKQQLRQRRS